MQDTAAASGSAPLGLTHASSSGIQHRPRGQYPARVSALVLGTAIILCSLLTWSRLQGTFFFADDDLFQMDVAQRHGFSRELLTLNVFAHFGPVNRLGHLFLLWNHLDVGVGAIASTGMVGLVLLSTSWLVTELEMSLVRRLMVVAAVGASLSLTDVGHWADAAWNILPVLAFTNSIIAMHVHGLRTGQFRWIWAAAALFPFGMLIQERAAFALPMVVLVDFLLVGNPTSFRSRAQRLWTVRWPLAAMTVMAACAALLIQRNYAGTAVWPSIDLVGRTIMMALTYQFPQLAGYQLSDEPSTIEQSVVIVIVGIAAALIIRANQNLAPVVFLFASFGIYWGFLIFSPILIPTNIGWTAGRLSNSAYITIPAFIALASLKTTPSWSRMLHSISRTNQRRWLLGGCLAALLVITVTEANVRRVIDRDWGPDREAHDFYAGALRTMETWSDPSVTVLPLRAPDRVAEPGKWSEQFGEQMFLLSLLTPRWQLRELTDATVVVDAQGSVHPVVLKGVAAASPSQMEGGTICNTPVNDGDGVQLAVSPAISTAPLFAVVEYESSTAGSIRSIAFDGDQYRSTTWSQPILTGSHRTIVPLSSGTVDAVRLIGMPSGSSLCIRSLDIVTPIAVQPDGTCREVAKDGRPGPSATCPDAS